MPDLLPWLKDIREREYQKFKEDCNGHVAVNVDVSNCQNNPVPVVIVDGELGDPLFFDAESIITPGVDQILLSVTVPAGHRYQIVHVFGSTRVASNFRVTVDGSLRGTLKTGAAQPNVSFPYKPNVAVNAGETITITHQTLSDVVAASVECYLQILDQVL